MADRNPLPGEPVAANAPGAPVDDPVAFAAWHEAQLAALCDQICAGVATAQTVLAGIRGKRELSKSPPVQAARLTIRRAKRCHCPQVSPPERTERPPRLP